MDEKIIYRIAIKISYYEALFEFEDLDDAGEFAKMILTHQVENDDTKKKTHVSIRTIVRGDKEEEVDE